MPGQMPNGALLRDLRDPDAISPSVSHYHTPTNGAHGAAILRDLRQPDSAAAAGSESAGRLTNGGGEESAWPSSAAMEGSEVRSAWRLGLRIWFGLVIWWSGLRIWLVLGYTYPYSHPYP